MKISEKRKFEKFTKQGGIFEISQSVIWYTKYFYTKLVFMVFIKTNFALYIKKVDFRMISDDIYMSLRLRNFYKSGKNGIVFISRFYPLLKEERKKF